MREIKFEAWDKNNKEILDVLKLDFRENLKIGLGYRGNLLRGIRWVKIDDVILRQFTGLKDKNGKEIYEGDIYQCPDKFSDEIFVIRNFIEDTYWLLDNIRNGYKPEVIGNIYENPELLKSSKR